MPDLLGEQDITSPKMLSPNVQLTLFTLEYILHSLLLCSSSFSLYQSFVFDKDSIRTFSHTLSIYMPNILLYTLNKAI